MANLIASKEEIDNFIKMIDNIEDEFYDEIINVYEVLDKLTALKNKLSDYQKTAAIEECYNSIDTHIKIFKRKTLDLSNEDYESLIEQYGDMRNLDEYIQKSKDISFFNILYEESKAFINKYFNENTKEINIEEKLCYNNFSKKDIALLKKIMFINENFKDSFNTHDSLTYYIHDRRYNKTNEFSAYSIIPFMLTALTIQGALEDKMQKDDQYKTEDYSKIRALKNTVSKYDKEEVNIDIYNPINYSLHNINATVYRRKLWYSAYKTTKNVQKEYKTNKIDIDQAVRLLKKESIKLSGYDMDPDIDWCYKKIDKLIKNYQSIKSNTPEL